MKKLSLLIIVLLSFVACKENNKQKTSNVSTKKEVKLEEGIYAKFTVTKGEFIVRLEAEKVPLTVANFVALAEGKMPNNFRSIGEPFYNGLSFHRVITRINGDDEDFMIQGGDPMGTGMGGPGYTFKDEFHADLVHKPGMMSMANSGPGTNGSQFFICVDERSYLNNRHSVFGEVIKGYDVVRKTTQNDIMKSIEILRIGEAANAFDALKTFNTLK